MTCGNKDALAAPPTLTKVKEANCLRWDHCRGDWQSGFSPTVCQAAHNFPGLNT